jgi:hypothetical protein
MSLLHDRCNRYCSLELRFLYVTVYVVSGNPLD